MKIGDMVILKSGGPTMTVNEIDDDRIWCVWFDAKNQHQQSSFNINTLKIVEQEK